MQPTVHIGFLPAFKGSDTLLLVSDHEALELVASVAFSLSTPGSSPVALHLLPFVNAHGVSVEANVGVADLGVRRSGNHFTWVRSPAGWRSVHELVQSLCERKAGHQYLDGPRDEVTVMLSVGQYGEGVWQSAV
jgi:hypothetical protein